MWKHHKLIILFRIQIGIYLPHNFLHVFVIKKEIKLKPKELKINGKYSFLPLQLEIIFIIIIVFALDVLSKVVLSDIMILSI